MADLDDLLIYRQLDTAGVINHLREFPKQCQRAAEQTQKGIA